MSNVVEWKWNGRSAVCVEIRRGHVFVAPAVAAMLPLNHPYCQVKCSPLMQEQWGGEKDRTELLKCLKLAWAHGYVWTVPSKCLGFPMRLSTWSGEVYKRSQVRISRSVLIDELPWGRHIEIWVVGECYTYEIALLVHGSVVSNNGAVCSCYCAMIRWRWLCVQEGDYIAKTGKVSPERNRL